MEKDVGKGTQGDGRKNKIQLSKKLVYNRTKNKNKMIPYSVSPIFYDMKHHYPKYYIDDHVLTKQPDLEHTLKSKIQTKSIISQ